MKFWVMSLAILALSACSAVPDELAVAENKTLVSYASALQQPEQAVGKTARWGGLIASVRNTDDGTIIEVVNFELTNWGRPIVSGESNGRFRARLDGFVDPMVYKEGRSVTFTGTIQQPEEGKIDEYRYLFPVLDVTGKFLWKERKEMDTQVDYSSLWYRHHYFAPPYRIYYPVPVRPARPRSGASDKQGNEN
ncbi:starvation-inducible protein [Pseudidiomarina salinarum]|uniref:Starvation-inducible protein n=1 Tax=Pseudidiomarina salinarum TaxID=435908 RepID=A0A094JGC7_9GAMM|nr:Slp family lipoprotein [Pseudidiomarina salinarum]KFZ31621.1 starvation-inducible protein [Pseudidiomarina salinarum]RUO70611.1 starvation-inducible protein [Pseudidiomarina salinarum]